MYLVLKEPQLLGLVSFTGFLEGFLFSSLFYIGLFSLLYWFCENFSHLFLSDLFLSELFQVSVAEMISLQQYRLAIGCFVNFHASLTSKSSEYVRVESKNVISV